MARFDWILHGIDEAGYGPRLGPLVQACASLRESSPTAVDFEDWEAVLAHLQATGTRLRSAAAAQGVAVGDSKALFSAARRQAGAGEAGSRAGAQRLWQALVAVGGGGGAGAAPGWPGWVQVAEEQHAEGEHPSAGLERDLLSVAPALAAAPVAAGRLQLQAVCLFPRQFNAWAGANNKAEINWALTARLVRARLAQEAGGDRREEPPMPTVWTLDRQGGRKRYGGLLSDLFAPAEVRMVMETAPLCVYRVRGERVNGWVTVKVEGEGWSVGTALASMAAKALREAAMARLNAFFSRQYPGLRPTAGYPEDAERWRAALKDRAGGAGIEWERLWRCK